MRLAQLRLLVTGGSGFLGSHLIERLQERGCRINLIDRWPYPIMRGYPGVWVPRSSQYDLTDRDAVDGLLKAVRPDIVIHLAARCGGIGANLKQPGTFFYDNLIMGVQLMEVARQIGVKKFVSIGTVCSYPQYCPTPFKEDELWNGYPEPTNAAYGLAKKMLLVQAQAYRQQYGFNAIHLLPVNLYGPRDHFDLEQSHVIPALVRRCIEARAHRAPTVTLWGSGTPTREFLYVADAAEGIALATERYDGAEPVNLGAGREITIRELAELIGQRVGYEGQFLWDSSKPDGQPRRLLDTSRAAQRFGFQASTTLEAGLDSTINWYLQQQPHAIH